MGRVKPSTDGFKGWFGSDMGKSHWTRRARARLARIDGTWKASTLASDVGLGTSWREWRWWANGKKRCVLYIYNLIFNLGGGTHRVLLLINCLLLFF